MKNDLRISRMSLSITLFLFYSLSCLGQSIRISSLNHVDSNKSLQFAMSSKYDTVIIGLESSPLYIAPMLFKKLENKVIILEKGVEILAKRDAFPETNDALMTFTDCINMKIEGNGAKLCMNKDEYITGEWRHGLSLRGCKNFSIRNLSIHDSGGDGIYIAGSQDNLYAEKIVIDSVKCVNNKRQGISIISAVDVSVTNCLLTQTKGTLPGAGLDIEPNKAADRIENINIINCEFKKNYGPGILISLGKLKKSSSQISVNIENCVLKSNFSKENERAAAEIVIHANKDSPVRGEVNFSHCLVADSNWGMLYSRKRADAFFVSFVNCAVRNIAMNKSSATIYLEVPDYRKHTGALGGFLFQDLVVANNGVLPFMIVRGSKLGTLSKVKSIRGTIIMFNSITEPVEYINYFPIFNENVQLDFINK